MKRQIIALIVLSLTISYTGLGLSEIITKNQNVPNDTQSQETKADLTNRTELKTSIDVKPEFNGTFPSTTAVTLITPSVWSSSPSTLSSQYPPLRYTSSPPTTPAPDCWQVASTWIYQQRKFCNAEDAVSYSEFRQAYYTCRGRCGFFPGASGEEQGQCACDTTCAVHGDCCEDMVLECASVYFRGTWDILSLLPASSVCDSESFVSVFRTCKHHLPTIHRSDLPSSDFKFSESFDPSILPVAGDFELEEDFEPAEGEESNSEPRKITIERYSGAFDHFKVIDLTLKVTFSNYDAFKACTSRRSTPHFVPKLTIAMCPQLNHTNVGRSSAAHVLDTCALNKPANVRTELDRQCTERRILSCRCHSNDSLTIPRHRACLGQVQSESLFPADADTIWRDDPAGGQLQGHAAVEEGQCEERVFPAMPIRNFRPQSHSLSEAKISITVVPVLLTVDDPAQISRGAVQNNARSLKNSINMSDSRNHESRIFNFESNLGTRPDGKPIFVTSDLNSDTSSYTAIKYVVKLSNTLERQLLCESLSNVLSECRLLECADWAVLTSAALDRGTFGQASCVLPDRSSVVLDRRSGLVPMCTCLRVMTALTRLRLWTVQLKSPRENGQCMFTLNLPPQELKLPPRIYQTSQLLEMSRPDLEPAIPLKAEYKLRLRSLLRDSSGTCAADSITRSIWITTTANINNLKAVELMLSPKRSLRTKWSWKLPNRAALNGSMGSKVTA
ncbi:hypothetical protein PoB_006954700 [Plakobranchus ocellatus]|uniref:SMB domain-containing protein n=1 Tax=Plakobranchus ocellatus TaxID=259542 RepID=A0AAV4DGC2_9GAST|nr:hypothetical protein PoB_006954700 [Plakobranchus ocellatus]